MEFQKIVNFLYTTFDDKDLPRFVTKKWIEVHDQSEKKKKILTNKLESKHLCEDLIYVTLVMLILL